jgi:hypothetical protein
MVINIGGAMSRKGLGKKGTGHKERQLFLYSLIPRPFHPVNNFFFKPTRFCVINHLGHIILWITFKHSLFRRAIMPQPASNALKKHGFPLQVERLFTRPDYDAYQLIHFREAEMDSEGETPALTRPDNWSLEAASVLADNAAASVPDQTRAIEENTVPSWLWRHKAIGKSMRSENGAADIFTRIVGSAAYLGWKQDLFADETAARAFYDEARYALAQRFIAIEPSALAALGLDWAYGAKPAAKKSAKANPKKTAALDIPNPFIDSIVSGQLSSGNKTLRGKWQKALNAKTTKQPVTLRFTDIAQDWGAALAAPVPAVIDLLAFRHNDGSVNIEALRHATRLLVLLLDLHGIGGDQLAIGFSNLAPLLMALGLAYDSNAGRSMAASLTAFITAEAFALSSELAALRGASLAFAVHREITLRALRNHRRAAYGDRNDYEKISVLPVALGVQQCPDLALLAAAQRRWDEVLEMVSLNGLRHTQVTSLAASPALTLYMESATQGIQALRSLIVTQTTDGEALSREIAPYAAEALGRLNYSRAAANAITQYIAGHHTLGKAPVINHATLRARGFDDAALNRVENYLPQVNDIRLAFTPWILGEDFCKSKLKLKLTKNDFDLLTPLGFNAGDIAVANAYVYGSDSARGCKDIQPSHAALFAKAGEVSAEAQIRMAASVQSFMSGDIALDLSLASDLTPDRSEKLLLSAWRQGLRSVTLAYTAPPASITAKTKASSRMSKFLHTSKPSLPTRRAKPKAVSRVLGMKQHAQKHQAKSRSK